MAGIFINYRRDDAKAEAGRISDRLSLHFGKNRVFMDVAGSIAPGQEFDQVIEKAVASSDALVVVIGKQWLAVADAGGRRRLDDPEDYVRKEIASALGKGKTIIPVLVHGVAMPTAEQLPDDLDRLAKKQALEISDSRWDYDSGQLIKALEMAGVEPAAKKPEKTETRDLEDIHQAAPALKFSRKAITGLVIAALMLTQFEAAALDQEISLGGMVFGLVALGLSFAAWYDVKQNKAKGRGLAIAGMALGGLVTLAFIGQMQNGAAVVPPVAPPVETGASLPPPSAPQFAAPEPPPPAQPANISGTWRGPDGMYFFQQSGNDIAFQLFAWNQALIAQGAGTITQGTVTIAYARIDNTGGEARLQVSANGSQMTGNYANRDTGETGPIVLVR